MLDKVISGGQTGADRAGLDAAIEARIPIGGYCPKGRLAEDGTIPEVYPLIELKTASYPARTEKNVKESDETLVLNVGKLSGGTKRTVEYAIKHGKAYLVVQRDQPWMADLASTWIAEAQIRILNIAGPRESKCPGLQTLGLDFLRKLFS